MAVPVLRDVPHNQHHPITNKCKLVFS